MTSARSTRCCLERRPEPSGYHVCVPVHHRVSDRLVQARAELCVGREHERERLASLLRPEGVAVIYVFGGPGIGKSAVVSAAVSAARRRALVFDAGRVEPTPSAFLQKAGEILGEPLESADALAETMGRQNRSLLVVDGYERLGLLDDWVRDVLVPALPATSSTILVSRRPPNRAWRSPAWRRLLAEVEVGPLTSGDAAALVARRVVRPELAAKVLRFGRGHPLALELASDAVARRADLDLSGRAQPEVVEQLIEVFLADLGPEMRALVEDLSLLRRVTFPMFAAVREVAGATADDEARLWQQFRELSFVDVGPAGAEITAVVRDTIATGVELREPGRAGLVRQAAGRAALVEAGRAPNWELTADLLHLVQNPIIRDAFSPPPGEQFVVDTARSTDASTIGTLVADADGQAGWALLERWWHQAPRCFRVLRGDAGVARGVAVVAPFNLIGADVAAGDPVLDHIGCDLAQRPLAAQEQALVVRRVLTAGGGEGPSSEYAALVVDLKRTYLELRPALKRVYALGADADVTAAALEPMGFVPIPGSVVVGSKQFNVWSLEFGTASVDGWLARHVEIESTRWQDPLTVASTGGPVRGSLVPEAVRKLSAREREVLAVLALGLTNRELADRLFISERTANRHLSNIFVKLGVRNRTEAARVAVAAGLG